MNTHYIKGRLVRDPELTQGAEPNKDRVNFTVAVDRKYGDETDFFDCVMFGKRTGVIKKYVSKGDMILCWGEGQIRSYEGRDGVKRKAYSIVLADFEFCGSRSDSAPRSDGSQKTEVEDTWEQADADIPF